MTNKDEEKMMNLKKLVLEKLHVRVTAPFTKEIFDHVEIGQLADMISMDMWIAALDILIPSKKIVRSGDVEYVPVTWWDHLKQTLGMKHKTRPIVTEEHHHHQCPHIGTNSPRYDHLEWLYYAGEPGKLRADIIRESEKDS